MEEDKDENEKIEEYNKGVDKYNSQIESENSETSTSLGLQENIEGALCYLLGFLTGIVFLILEPNNKFVRFHAVQSIAVFLPLFVLGVILSSLTWVFYAGWTFWMLSNLLWALEFILWIVLMAKAYSGEKFKLPVVGEIAEQKTM